MDASTSLFENIFDVRNHASGPTGCLPLPPDFFTNAPSGLVFGWTQGGIRAEDGSPSHLVITQVIMK